MRAFEPLIVLIVLPALIGIAAAMLARDTRNASLVAMLACALAVFGGVNLGNPDGTWHWLAASLVLPLPIAVAVSTVFVWHGRDTRHRAGHES